MNEYEQKYNALVYFRQVVQPINRWNKLLKAHREYNLPPLYAEYHHIKPKSIYPQLAEDKANVVCLTAYEHVLAHKYLMLWFIEEFGQYAKQSVAMTKAYLKTIHKNTGRDILVLSDEDAAQARILGSNIRSHIMRERWKDPVYRKHIENSTKGRPKSEITKQRMKQAANTPEAKARLSKQASYKRSKLVRKHMSDAQKINQNRPEVQAARNAGIIRAKQQKILLS